MTQCSASKVKSFLCVAAHKHTPGESGTYTAVQKLLNE